MPTSNPRVTVTLRPSTYAVLKRISGLNRESISSMLADLAEQAEPVLERTVRVMEASLHARAEVRRSVKENLEAAEKVLEKQLGLMLGDIETRNRDAVDDLEAITRRQPKAKRAGCPPAQPGGRRPAQPPHSNRGGATSNPLKRKGPGKPAGRRQRGSR